MSFLSDRDFAALPALVQALIELDFAQARDGEYRALLSTWAKSPLAKGETWRNRVIKLIEMQHNKVKSPC